MSDIKLDDLDEWLANNFNDDQMISVRGGFRNSRSFADPTIPIFDIRGIDAHTLRVTIPLKAPLAAKSGQKIASDCFAESTEKWWDVWASVLASSAIVPPNVDPVTMSSILSDKRQLRLCCDTNALCNGTVAWLLQATNGKATILTSAVVDRELAAWPDKGREKFWNPKTMDWLVRRTHYRIARRLIERPEDDIVVDRLSPEQSALMLAKLRDEDKDMSKSPDADMLLIELARLVVREQPLNARVLYVTGDRNNARAAAGAIGATNVLFAAVDRKRARTYQGSVVSRGWWTPHGPLGATMVPSTANLLWNTLAACDFLALTANNYAWRIKPAANFQTGTPSDWETPWVTVEPYPSPRSSPPIPANSGPAAENTLPPVPSDLSVLSEENATVNVLERQTNPERNEGFDARDSTDSDGKEETWLMPPVSEFEDVDGAEGWRPTPKVIFDLLSSMVTGIAPDTLADGKNELVREGRLILMALGAINERGTSAKNSEDFRRAWLACDLDWFHHNFLRLPGYRKTWQALNNEETNDFNARQQVNVRMARTLGQAVMIDRKTRDIRVGDAPITLEKLLKALSEWLPSVDATMAISDLCWHAQQELRLTPARFEIAMMKLWQLRPTAPFEIRTGGTVIPGPVERVVVLLPTGYTFREVETNALSFGQEGFARFITRTSNE